MDWKKDLDLILDFTELCYHANITDIVIFM